VTISQERIRPRRPTRNSISVSNRPAPSGTRRRPEVRGRWVIHPRPFIGPVMLASPRLLTSQNRSSLTRPRSKRDSSLRSPMTFREGEGPILEPIENRSGIGRPVARKYSNAVRALLAMPDHTTKRPGNQNRILTTDKGRFIVRGARLAPAMISTPGHRASRRRQRGACQPGLIGL
jgi:hypothetical protein